MNVLFKRKPKPIEIDGEKYYARSMTVRQVMAINREEDEAAKMQTVVGIIADCLTDADGNPVFSGPDDAGLQELPLETLGVITDRIGKLSRPGDFAKIEKN